jgi:hypothetical protein
LQAALTACFEALQAGGDRDMLPWTERVQIEQLCRELEAMLKAKAP